MTTPSPTLLVMDSFALSPRAATLQEIMDFPVVAELAAKLEEMRLILEAELGDDSGMEGWRRINAVGIEYRRGYSIGLAPLGHRDRAIHWVLAASNVTAGDPWEWYIFEDLAEVRAGRAETARAAMSAAEAALLQVAAAAEGAHFCASPSCPGYPYRASEQRHPCVIA